VKRTELDFPLDLAVSTAPRSPGLHVSAIYSDLFQDLEPDRYVRGSLPDATRMAVGLAWESHLEKMLELQGIHAYRPAECRSPEGIAYSPDLVIVNGEDRIGEVKCTWKSSRGALADPKFDIWMTQAKIYCHWTEIPRVRFFVLFVNGSYGRTLAERSPEFRVWDIEYTARELQDNYQMLMNHMRHKGMKV
jgi:hypothetical protein